MDKIWTVLDILNWTTTFLEKKNIEEAKYKTELLLSHVLEFKRFDLYLNFDRPLSQEERKTFKKLLNRLTESEPIQYILGKWEFYGYDFIVNKNVLIPRRETEELVEKVINYITNYEKQYKTFENTLNIFDVGTGSGAIIISLYMELKNKLKKENFEKLTFTAVDISEKALVVAKENAELNNAENINFIKSDLLYGVENNIDILVSNPPYVSLSEYNNLKKELFFEPKQAITDNNDGLYFYNKLISSVTEKNIKKIFFEIGYNQKNSLTEMCSKYKIKNFKFYKDLSGNYRIFEITI